MQPDSVQLGSPPRPDLPGAGGSEELARRGVWRYLRALGASVHDADDLAQEAVVVAWRRPRAVGPIDDAFLRGVARNLWLRSRRWWQRRREREIAVAVDELWAATVADDGGDELIARLRACLAVLQPRVRQALDLHYRDGLAAHQVGALLSLRPNGVKTLLQRARQALRTCIERRER
jgi:RNA polymerase sigma-70 factor, ECF subfamily